MDMISIVLITIAVLMVIEGLIISIFPKQVKKAIKQIFKNQKQIVKIGLIEVIIGLLILFILSL